MVLEFDLRALCLLGKNIIISEVSQFQKAKVHMFSLICGIKINTNKSNIIYTYKCTQKKYAKLRLVEETKKGGKEAKKDSN
jgi:hypothetical protein